MAEQGYEVAKAVVTLIPSMQGSQAAITKELTGASAVAGKSAGETMGKNMGGGLSSSMSSVGKTIAGVTAGILGSVAAVGAAVMESFKEVDAGLDTIRTKTGASGQDLEGMKTSMENLATSIPTSFEEAGAAIGEVNTRFKLTGQDLEDLSGKFIKFAQLNNTDVSSAVDSVSKVVNSFGMEASDAGNLLDALNKVGQNTGVDIGTLTSALSQNAAQLQEMGLNAYDAAGFLGECDVAGLEISTTMMGLKTAMKNATKEGKPLDTFLGEFTDTMNSNASESDKLTAAYETFGTRAGGAIYNAVKNGKINLEDLTGSLGDFEGSVDSTFESVTDPTDEFTEAMNRLKIAGADIAESMMPVIAGAVEGIAGAIDWLIDAITPAESSLTRFIKSTKDSIEANKEALENVNGVVDDAVDNVGKIDFYKDVIMDLNEKSTLTELEQYKLKDAVQQLSDIVPGLASAWDETTGTLNLTNEELDELFNNSQKLIIQTAMMDVQVKSVEALAEAMSAEAAARHAAEEAATQYKETTEKTYSGTNAALHAMGVASAVSDEEAAVIAATQAWESAKEETEAVKAAQEDLPNQLKELAIEAGATEEEADLMAQGLYGVADSSDKAGTAVEETGETVGITAEEFASLAEKTGLSEDELAELAGTSDMTVEELEDVATEVARARQAFEDLKTGVESSIKSSMSIFDEFTGGTKIDVKTIVENLHGANVGVEQWIEDMKVLGEKAGDEFPQALYDELLEQGPEKTANAVHAMAEAADDEGSQFKEIAEEYAKNLDLSEAAGGLARYSSTGKAVSDKTAEGIKSGSDKVKSATTETVKGAADAADQEVKTGTDKIKDSASKGAQEVVETAKTEYDQMPKDVQSVMTDADFAMSTGFGNMKTTAAEKMNSVNNTILGYLNTMVDNFSTKAASASGSISDMISSVSSALRTPLYGPNIKVPHFKMVGDFDAKTKSVPTVTVDWYAKGGIFMQPTIFATPYGFKGVGESGPEAVLPIEQLKNYIEDATASPVINMNMTVNGAESPEVWAAEFARSVRQMARIG